MFDYMNLLNNFDPEKLRAEASSSVPFPYFYVDNFLEKTFAEEIYSSFPSYDKAFEMGRSFSAPTENKKVQITDENLFPGPIAKLNNLLKSEEFLEKLGYIMDIPKLVSDPKLTGGGIHETNGGGRLDVHVDFNYNKELKLFRRVNILIYFNKDWKDEYGGILDLWDEDVKKCYAKISPIFNRMACFATSEISYHGVTPINCPKGVSRKSFAGYYYTSEPPENWDGEYHSTVFKQRPHDWHRRYFNIPYDSLKKSIKKNIQKILR